jgi:hypothetical protein
MDDSVLDEIMASVLARRATESFTSDGDGFSHSSSTGEYDLPPFKAWPWSFVTASNAKTLDIGNKESARIAVTLRVCCASGVKWKTLTEANRVVDAILEAEVSALGSKDKKKTSIESEFTDAVNPRIMLGVEYGLTLNLGGYQFAKPAAGMTVTCSPGTLNQAYGDIIAGLKEELGKMVKTIRSGKKTNPDIGL